MSLVLENFQRLCATVTFRLNQSDVGVTWEIVARRV